MLLVWAVSTATMAALAGVLPDFRIQSPGGDSPTRIAITAAVAAGAFGLLGALVWPVLVRAVLLVPAFVLGLLVFFLNGSLLLIAFRFTPDWQGDISPATAVVIAAVMSAASSGTSTALAMRDDAAYGRRLARLAGRRRRPRGGGDGAPRAEQEPGFVFVQLDGVGHDVLREAVRPTSTRGGRLRPPAMETVARWLDSTHRLVPWITDWSSQTGASQLAILHGSDTDVPAFRWYEKETGQVMVCNRPSCAAELERRAVARTGRPGLLAPDGASRGNLFSGGAEQLALVMSVSTRRRRFSADRRAMARALAASAAARVSRGLGRDAAAVAARAARVGETGSRTGYFAYFSDPANAVRTAASFVAEVVREIGESVAARLRGDRPRVRRGGLYPFLRAFATVVERDVAAAAVVGDMLAGRTAVYADLVAYDEVAHHSGPRSRDAIRVLRRLDRVVRMIADASRYAPRPYRLVLLSDHGQSHGETFESAYGLTLKDLVRAGCGLPVRRRARRTVSGAEARAAARAALNRPEGGRHTEEEHATAGPSTDPIVLASGNLGLISFPDLPGRADRARIEARHPALLRTLAEHPGIGFLLVQDAARGPLVLGPGGGEHELDSGRVTGPDPLAPFGPHAVAAVRRTAGFPHAADVMVNSAYDPVTRAVHAFEEQVGSHGGLGGDQSRAFLLHPYELEGPGPDERLVGARAVHGLFGDWLRRKGTLPAPREEAPDAAGPTVHAAAGTPGAEAGAPDARRITG
ncbi:phage holin family protein [Streptomyces sp. NPDC088733]|uniref:phage holin family protein n=1 Tax=Streptomyces sp. NPDC088733 TaxID=3365880 RepID=UPI0038103985